MPDINERQIVVLSVSKREVAGKIFDRALHVISQLEALGTDARNYLAVTFEYDDVPEEIFEIAEIREWEAGLLERVPHLFYFITRFGDNQQSIAACLADLEAIKPMPSMTHDQIMKYVSEHGKAPEMLLNIRIPKHLCNMIFRSSLAYACRVHDNIKIRGKSARRANFFTSIRFLINPQIYSSDAVQIPVQYRRSWISCTWTIH